VSGGSSSGTSAGSILRTLPGTGGMSIAPLLTLGSGILLIGGGVLTRRFSR
jgi:hypothetical protein